MKTEMEAKPVTASANVADALISQIKQGAIQVGDPLPSERDLCDQYEVSRPTVREALVQLQQRGFANLSVSRRPRAQLPTLNKIFEGAGSLIQDLLSDRESVAYMDQMRQFIEVGAIRQVAEHATNAQVARIHKALDNCLSSIADLMAFKSADIEFHRAIVGVVDNPIILGLHDMFVTAMLAQRPTANDTVAHRNKVYEEHRLLFEAILQKAPDKAAKTMETHLARAYRERLPQPTRIDTGNPVQGED